MTYKQQEKGESNVLVTIITLRDSVWFWNNKKILLKKGKIIFCKKIMTWSSIDLQKDKDI